MQDKIVTREHTVKFTVLKKAYIEGRKGEKVYKADEIYQSYTITTWTCDKNENRLKNCAVTSCSTYTYKHSGRFICLSCVKEQARRAKRAEDEQRYRIAFDKRVKTMIKDVRKEIGHGARKGRKQTTLIYDSFGSSEEWLKNAEQIAARHNCSLGSYQGAIESSYGRRYVYVKDINPFKKENLDEV